MARPDITADYLRSLLDYDSTTGIFTWRVRRNANAVAGSVAGCLTHQKYIQIYVDNWPFRAHRLAWLHYYGRWPVGILDHRNGKGTENWIKNLLEATDEINAQNLQRAQSNNKCGFLGVHIDRGTGRFVPTIGIDNGKYIYLGSYDTPEQAHAAYVAAKRRLREGCTI